MVLLNYGKSANYSSYATVFTIQLGNPELIHLEILGFINSEASEFVAAHSEIPNIEVVFCVYTTWDVDIELNYLKEPPLQLVSGKGRAKE